MVRWWKLISNIETVILSTEQALTTCQALCFIKLVLSLQWFLASLLASHFINEKMVTRRLSNFSEKPTASRKAYYKANYPQSFTQLIVIQQVPSWILLVCYSSPWSNREQSAHVNHFCTQDSTNCGSESGISTEHVYRHLSIITP